MEIEKEIIENQANVRLLDQKVKLILEMLSREGIIDKEEFEEEFLRALKKE